MSPNRSRGGAPARPTAPWVLAVACAPLFACAMSPEDPYAYQRDDCSDTVAHAAPPMLPAMAVAPPFEGAGYMTIVCAPHCEVFENGAFVGPSPIVDMAAAAGEHRIEVRGPGGVERTVVIRVEPGRVTKKRVVLFRQHAHAKGRRHRHAPASRDD